MREDSLKRIRRTRRSVRARKKILADKTYPRLTVFRSNNHIYAQIIDDKKGMTLASASEFEIKEKMTKNQRAEKVGEALAQKAKEHKITKVVFDKGSYKYHGRIKALADAARKEGLVF